MAHYLVVPSETQERPANHGRPWTDQMKTNLVLGFCRGDDLALLGENLGRKYDAICAKLSEFRLVLEEQDTHYRTRYRVLPANRLLTKANSHLANWGHTPIRVVNLANCDPSSPKQNPTLEAPNQEPIMSAPTIETKTFIAGVDAKELSDDDIFKRIAQLENQCESLAKIQHKPKKLSIKIAGLQDDIAKLVEFVDGRP